MKFFEDTKMKLKIINYSVLILLIISAALIIVYNTKILGTILVFVSLFLEWKLYRCPNCKKVLDQRVNISKHPYCPNCGKEI